MSRLVYLSAFFITISAVFASAPTVYDPATNVTYVGLTTINGTVEKFLNIPYGNATRFTAPVLAPLQSNSVYDASKQGLVCPQQVSGGIVFQTNVSFGEQSEDCLRLKVARPAGTKAGDELPVMVYIYGGGLWDGHINERTSEPDGLIVQSAENGLPVVYVAMNYRLNIFGFALSDALRPSNDLNVGLKDQRLALEWVQQNIALFGGDPSRVTIFGQSSGGLSVAMQVLAYGGARGAPFHGAIMQSTALEPTSTSNLSLITFNSVANMTGCDSFGNPQGEATLECMRALPLEVLLNATLEQYKEGSKNNDGDIYLPTVDGDFLPLSSSELTLKGMFTRMPIVAGWMEDDASLFTPPTIATPDDTRVFLETIYPDMNATTLDALLDLYPVGEFDANVMAGLSAEFYRSARVFRDVLFVCPSVLFGNAVAQKYISDGGEGNTTNQTASADNTTAPVFLYAHNQTIFSTFLDDEGSPGLGIIHTSDLPYVFANFTPYNVLGDVHPTSHDEELRRRMSRSWSTFAYNGSMASDPSSSGSLSLDGKEMLQGWEGSWAAGDAVGDAKVYVVGGGTPGLQGLESGTLKGQRLAERCAFLNSEEVIAQLKY